MKTSYLLLYCLLLLSPRLACLNNKNNATSGNPALETSMDNSSPVMASKMKIKIGARIFTATFYDNEAAATFKSMLPLSLNMVELNGNEKYAELPGNLPANASNPGKIQSGDLMLYGASTLVLFYKTFSSSYSYTKLGRIDDVAGLSEAVGLGNVAVGFELE